MKSVQDTGFVSSSDFPLSPPPPPYFSVDGIYMPLYLGTYVVLCIYFCLFLRLCFLFVCTHIPLYLYLFLRLFTISDCISVSVFASIFVSSCSLVCIGGSRSFVVFHCSEPTKAQQHNLSVAFPLQHLMSTNCTIFLLPLLVGPRSIGSLHCHLPLPVCVPVW